MNKIKLLSICVLSIVFFILSQSFAQRAQSQQHMPEKRKTLGVNIDSGWQGGIKVTSVVPDGTADNMGMKAGDTIIAILDSSGVWQSSSLNNRIVQYLQMMQLGDEMQLKVLRNKKEKILKGKVGGMKNPPIRHYSNMTVLGTYIVSFPDDYETSKKRYPVCIILHGSGSIEGHEMLGWLDREDVIFVCPRAPYPHLEVFLGRRHVGWTAGHPDGLKCISNEGIDLQQKYADWVVQCFEEVKEKYRVLGDKMFIVGHSEGGGMANVTAALYPDKVASCYSYAGMMPEHLMTEAYFSKMRANDVKVHLVHGRNDQAISVDSSIFVEKKMKDAGVNVSLRLYDAPHSFTREIQEDLDNWLDEEVRLK